MVDDIMERESMWRYKQPERITLIPSEGSNSSDLPVDSTIQ
jgi:hypothetical protein